MAILEITKYSKAHQKEINEQPQIPGVLRMHNGFSVDTEASYKALYVASGAKTVEVVRAALDRNGKLKESPADFVIVLEEDGVGKWPFFFSSCFLQMHPVNHTNFLYYGGFEI